MWRASKFAQGRIHPLANKTMKIGHHLAYTAELPYNVTLRERRTRVVLGELTL